MKKDYPQANARLSEVAKHWAEGEVSHEVWRKERRTIIEALVAGGRDWLQSDNIVKKASSLSRATLPAVTIPMPLAASYPGGGHAVLAQSEVSSEDVLLLAVLLFVMIMTAIVLLYIL